MVFKKLLVHTCNMNFTKDVVLCEIIERHESKSIIVVVNFFIVGLSYSRHFNVDSPVNQCRVPWLNQRWIMCGGIQRLLY